MTVYTAAEIEELKSRSGREADVKVPAGDISGGVEEDVSNVPSFTLFFEVGGAVDLTIELSPDNGENWYEPASESPVSFGSAGQDLVQVAYDVTRVRVTANNTTNVKVQYYEVV